MREVVERALMAHRRAVEHLAGPLGQSVAEAAELVVAALRARNKVMLCGNGGSAADAQHLAAELTGRYLRERQPLPALALTTDTSALTAIANDYGYEQVFSRQVEALACAGDVLLAISTSGKSPSVLRAVERARALGCRTIGLAGGSGGPLAALVDLSLVVPVTETARIQEMHILIGHMLCECIDEALTKP
jgi:D-sedoheptulose 7-phosphate isomerase